MTEYNKNKNETYLKKFKEKKNSKIKIPFTIKRKINRCLFKFNTQTSFRSVITFTNGFIGVGILEKATDHILKKINTFWHYSINFDGKNKDIQILANEEMDLQEAESLYKCLGKCINKFREECIIERKTTN